MSKPRPTFDFTLLELEEFLGRVRSSVAQPDDEIIQSLVSTVREMSELLDDKTASVSRLRALLLGASTAKTRDVIDASRQPAQDGQELGADPTQHQRKGHGRNGAKAYTGATRVAVPHETLRRRSAARHQHL